MHVAFAAGDLIGLVKLGKPRAAVEVAAGNRLDRPLVGLEHGVHGDGHVGRHHVLAVAQHAEAPGEIRLQLEAAELELGGAAADDDALFRQRRPQLLAELVAQRPLRQVELLLQFGDDRQHRRFAERLQDGEGLVQVHDVHRLAAERGAGLLQGRGEGGQALDLAPQVGQQRIDGLLLQARLAKGGLGAAHVDDVVVCSVVAQGLERLALGGGDQLEGGLDGGGGLVPLGVAFGEDAQLTEQSFVWHGRNYNLSVER